MQAELLEVLEKANLPSVQACAIVRAIEIELAGAKDVLATKPDVVLLRGDVRQEVTPLRSERAARPPFWDSEWISFRDFLMSGTENLRRGFPAAT